MLLFLFLLSIFTLGVPQTNIIQNWDFQSHPAFNGFTSCPQCFMGYYYYVLVSGSTYNWYDTTIDSVQFRQKRMSSSSLTTVVDLCGTQLSQICQKIAVEPATYELKYTVCKNQFETCSYYSLLIGVSLLFFNNSICSNSCIEKVYEIQNNFTETKNLCFRGEYNPGEITCTLGTLIDNITLIKVQYVTKTIQLNIPILNAISPAIVITTNLSLSSTGSYPFTCSQFIPLIQSLKINGATISSASFYCSTYNSLQILATYTSNESIANASIQISNVRVNYIQYRFNSTFILQQNDTNNINQTNLSPTQDQIVNWLNEINQPLALRLSSLFTIGKLMGLGYQLFSLFAFWEIAIYFNYVFIKTPDFVKQSMQKVFKNFMMFGIFQQFHVEDYVYHKFSLPLTESIPQTNNQWLWFRQLGFTSNFYTNNIQCIFLLLVGLFKSGLMHLVYLLTGWKYFKMKQHWFGHFLMDLLSWVPFLALTPGIMLYNCSLYNSADKLNFILNIIVLFFCFQISFIFLFTKFKAINNAEKRNKKKKQAKHDKKQTIYFFMDFIFVIFLTFCTGISNKNGFLLVAITMIISKIVFLIRNRKIFNKIDIFFKLGIQLIWLTYCLSFILFWLIQQMSSIGAIDSNTPFWISVINYTGIASLLLFTIGCWFEIIHLIVTFFFEIKEGIIHFYKYICQKCSQGNDKSKKEKECKDKQQRANPIPMKKPIKINILQEQIKKDKIEINVQDKTQIYTDYRKKCIQLKGYSGQKKKNPNILHINQRNDQSIKIEQRILTKTNAKKFQNITPS